MTRTRAYRIREEIFIEAPRPRVFRALTDPEEICRWWAAPGEWETTGAEVDLRVGGRYVLSGTSVASGTFEVRGEYMVVSPPERLAYTWNPDWVDGAEGSIVRIELVEEDGGTRIEVEHTGLSSEAAFQAHRSGWPGVLAALKARTTVSI